MTRPSRSPVAFELEGGRRDLHRPMSRVFHLPAHRGVDRIVQADRWH